MLRSRSTPTHLEIFAVMLLTCTFCVKVLSVVTPNNFVCIKEELCHHLFLPDIHQFLGFFVWYEKTATVFFVFICSLLDLSYSVILGISVLMVPVVVLGYNFYKECCNHQHS